MRRLQPRLLLVFLFLLVGFTMFVNMYLSRNQIREHEESVRTFTNPSVDGHNQRKIDDATFTPSAYIAPLEANVKGSIYSSRVYLRGVVVSWKPEGVKVAISGDQKEIRLPAAVYLYCAPVYVTDKNGNQALSSSTWLNFPKPEQVGTLVPTGDLPKKITPGKDIAVLANVGSADVMTAYFVVGYGCSVEKH